RGTAQKAWPVEAQPERDRSAEDHAGSLKSLPPRQKRNVSSCSRKFDFPGAFFCPEKERAGELTGRAGIGPRTDRHVKLRPRVASARDLKPVAETEVRPPGRSRGRGYPAGRCVTAPPS